MAVEKMIMVNMVGHIDDMDSVCKSVVLSKSIHPINALQEIDTTNFTITATENNLEELIDVCYIRPYTQDKDYNDIQKKMNEIKRICTFNDKYRIKEQGLLLDFENIKKNINIIYEEFNSKYIILNQSIINKSNIEVLINNLEYIKDVDVPIENIVGLENFSFELYKISKENMVKLKGNYENIPAIVTKIYSGIDYETVMSFTPKLLKNETDRVFKSLNCQKIEVPLNYKGKPKEVVEELKDELTNISKEIEDIKLSLDKASKEKGRDIYLIEKSLQLEVKSDVVKNTAACTDEFFYLCGWVPESMIRSFKARMLKVDDKLIIIEKKPEEIKNNSIIPPTKLKNNLLVRPFEAMVGMYGIPSYNELDPTTFLSISYTIMFGAMFGDLGQGMIFFLAGLILQFKKNRPNLGGVLSRLGISSSIFGLLYGSIFGFETIIPALLVRPMENISEVLLYAIVFGCGLLLIGFAYSLINSVKRKDLENGLFGKNGAAGMAFYLIVLFLIYTKFKNIKTMSNGIYAVILIALLVVILLKQPITNLIKKKQPLFNESKGDYFIEGGFGIVEVLLSLFSNTLSFIRVGAFALNHVGLFTAFAALAQMMKNGAMSVTMYVLGNLIIIGLEGLIVFIQGLRLEYYELFSKYYEGEGIAFEPIQITMEN